LKISASGQRGFKEAFGVVLEPERPPLRVAV
jgi:hypothetical protein